MEKGSDRMALITARIKNLPSSPPSSPHHDSRTESFFSKDIDHQMDPHTPLPHHINAGPKGKYDASGSTLPKHEIDEEVSRGSSFEIGSQVESQTNICDTSIEARQDPAVDYRTKTQTSLGTSILQKTSSDRPFQTPHRRHRPSLFTSRRINSCIIASETTRFVCALIIAFLVVLSYVDYPLFGRNLVESESVVASRPLYILLLTDVTIVLTRLFLATQRDSGEAEEQIVIPQVDGHNWAKAEKVLERGLVVYQTFRAIFIDCSVYAVVVICGLSLV